MHSSENSEPDIEKDPKITVKIPPKPSSKPSDDSSHPSQKVIKSKFSYNQIPSSEKSFSDDEKVSQDKVNL